MRLVALALIVAAFALAALNSVARAKRRARLLEALCASLELLRGEVVTRLTPLPDCAALLSRTGPWECREFYASLGLAMDSLGELEFSRLWEACVSALELGEELARRGVPTVIRHVLVPGITDSEEEVAGVGRIIGDWDNVVGLDLLPYHTMGRSKYEKLGIAYPLEGVPAMEPARAKGLRAVALRARAERRAERGR